MLSSRLILLTALLISVELIQANEEAENPPENDSRIVGGTPTTISAVPYLVNLRVNGGFNCGGSLINPTTVVTAAHCVNKMSPKSLSVYGGSTKISSGGVRRSVSKIIVHSDYNPNTQNYDVAVLKLSSPMTGTNIKPIKLHAKALKAGTSLKVSGWGLLRENGSSSSDTVQTVNVPVMAKSSCIKSYRGYATVTNSMVCASVPGKKDSCSGDSGGPAVCNNQLCGIVSWGIGCARKNFPGVYTDVNAVRSFILAAKKK